MIGGQTQGFRPLYGVSLFLHVHSRVNQRQEISFRPLYGVSLFLPSPCYPAWILALLSSLRGKPANWTISFI